jgi:hypothetical protein
MGFFSGFKKVVKPLVDVPRWMHLDRLVQQGKAIKELANEIFIVKTPQEKETFEQAMERLDISDSGLQKRIGELKWLFFFYVLAFLGIFGYGTYLFLAHYPRAGFLAYAVSMVAFSQAFRQHFWFMQLKHQSLGMSFKQWYEITFTGKLK